MPDEVVRQVLPRSARGKSPESTVWNLAKFFPACTAGADYRPIPRMKKQLSKRTGSKSQPSRPRYSAISTDMPAPACYVFADILRQARINQGLTVKDAERRSGVSDTMIACIEKKSAVPTLDKAFRLLDVYRIQMVLVDGQTHHRL